MAIWLITRNQVISFSEIGSVDEPGAAESDQGSHVQYRDESASRSVWRNQHVFGRYSICTEVWGRQRTISWGHSWPLCTHTCVGLSSYQLTLFYTSFAFVFCVENLCCWNWSFAFFVCVRVCSWQPQLSRTRSSGGHIPTRPFGLFFRPTITELKDHFRGFVSSPKHHSHLQWSRQLPKAAANGCNWHKEWEEADRIQDQKDLRCKGLLSTGIQTLTTRSLCCVSSLDFWSHETSHFRNFHQTCLLDGKFCLESEDFGVEMKHFWITACFHMIRHNVALSALSSRPRSAH